MKNNLIKLKPRLKEFCKETEFNVLYVKRVIEGHSEKEKFILSKFRSLFCRGKKFQYTTR